jgi:large subunit ribosomal protein L4
MKINIYSASSNAKSTFSLPSYFNVPKNAKLLAQALHVYRARIHTGSSKVKTRGEVSLTKAKWYRQKGTGRARHGAKSAPIFVGGGVAHGPKGIKRTLSLPKKMRRKARDIALSIKARDKKVVGVIKLENVKKTKDAAALVEKIAKKEKITKKNFRFTLILSDKNKEVERNFRNIPNSYVVNFSDLNAYQVYYGGELIFDKEVFKRK